MLPRATSSTPLPPSWSVTRLGPHRDVFRQIGDAVDRAQLVFGAWNHLQGELWAFVGLVQIGQPEKASDQHIYYAETEGFEP